jgi:hypothetical protein
MSSKSVTTCDGCGVEIERKDSDKISKGAIAVSFSAYFYGPRFNHAPSDFDSCSKKCAIKLLKIAIADLGGSTL